MAGTAADAIADMAERMLKEKDARIAELEDALSKLVDDVENKWGDPHTLRHAKQSLQNKSKST